MSDDLVPKSLEGEIIGPGETLNMHVDRTATAEPTIANGGLKISVDILAAMTETCQEEVNYFKNWNQKWNQHKSGHRGEQGPCLPTKAQP